MTTGLHPTKDAEGFGEAAGVGEGPDDDIPGEVVGARKLEEKGKGVGGLAEGDKPGEERGPVLTVVAEGVGVDLLEAADGGAAIEGVGNYLGHAAGGRR